MNLEICCALPACPLDVTGRHLLPANLHLSRDQQQCLQLVGDLGALEVLFHGDNKVFVAAQVMCGDRAMNCLAISTVILA